MDNSIYIIGSGFSSLSSACYLAKAGYKVTVLEKNESLGGRARQFKQDGFTFDMGPSWYWMPDVFERFFADFDKTPEQFYKLDKLNPGYQVVFGKNDFFEVADNLNDIYKAFDKHEQNGSKKLKKFIDKAKTNYDIAIKKLVYKPGESPLELITKETVGKLGQFFSNIDKDVEKDFKNDKLKQILKFPVLFLGARPEDTPSFYSFMNYADFGLGTWHPKGGMFSVVKAMKDLGESLGVTYKTNSTVEHINVVEGNVESITVNGEVLPTFDGWLPYSS